MIEIGDMAPQARFELADGKQASTADWRGQNLVVYFYPKDDTGGCTKEAQAFTALMPEFSAVNTVVLGISKDSTKSHVKFVSKYDLGIILGSDPDGSVCEAFGVWVEKSMYGRQYMGIERSTFLIGSDGKIVAVWRKVKVPGHAESVLTKARELAEN
jgi:thioredoxin-dependent peroxiredoxin